MIQPRSQEGKKYHEYITGQTVGTGDTAASSIFINTEERQTYEDRHYILPVNAEDVFDNNFETSDVIALNSPKIGGSQFTTRNRGMTLQVKDGDNYISVQEKTCP